MMLDERTGARIKLEAHRDDGTRESNNGVNFVSGNPHANFGQPNAIVDDHVDRTHLHNNLFSNPQVVTNISRSAIKSDSHQHQHIREDYKALLHNQHSQNPINEEQYLTSDETNSSGYNQNPDTPASNSGTYDNNPGPLKPPHSSSGLVDLNADTRRHSLMVPTTAHCSEQQVNMHYSLSTTAKSLPASSPSSMALNFSHDLLQGHLSPHHHPNDNNDHKHGQLSGSLDLESGSHLMQAANMNMWKNSMGLGFKHSSVNEHSPFLPASDMNSFSNWTHANNLSHQTAPAMSHPILDGQHLIGYSQHNQRSLPLPNQQDLVGATLKNQVCAEQASLMLNSINQVSQAQLNEHHSSHQSSDNHLHLRSNSHDHNATSYNLSMNDSQFYSNRSHGNTIKSSVFLQDRSGPSHSNHHASHLSYHSAEHLNPQPTTSHHVAASSSGSSSRNIGTFKCPHCSEIFNMRHVYQTHLKSHSQEKGSKAKFHCELCGHSFSQKTSLNRHMKSHTGERPFPCEVCGKAFSEKERLKIHMRTHTGEKPFSCGICGKSFSQKSTVKRHQTVHTGEKKFKCDCGKGFANRGNLIAHIKTRGANHFE